MRCRLRPEEIRPVVNKKMGVYAKLFFQDVTLYFPRDSILAGINPSVPVEATVRDKLNTLLIEVMESPEPPPPVDDSIQKIRKIYAQLNADYQIIQEVRNQLKSQKINPLIKDILAKFDAFELEVEAFVTQETPRTNLAEKTAYIDKLQAHAQYIRLFKNRLDNYQFLANKDNLHNYEELQGEKRQLSAQSKEKNEAMRQKITFISTYETHLLAKCEHCNRHAVASEINTFVRALNLYDALVEISTHNNKLIIQLNDEIAKLNNPSNKNTNLLALKQQQLGKANDIKAIIEHPEMPVQQKIKILKQFITHDLESNKTIYTEGFGKKISGYLSVLNEFSSVVERKPSFFSSHGQGSYVNNITPDVLLPRINGKLEELTGKTDKASVDKREVLKAASQMLNDDNATKEDLTKVMREHPDYNSFFGPDIKKLVLQTLDCLTQVKRIASPD